MATATKRAPAKKVPAKKATATKKAAPAKAAADNGQRGRPRDEAEEARILKALLPNVTVDGEGVKARVTGIGEAASQITLESGKALDTTRAKMILLRHLAKEAGQSVKPNPQLIRKARDEKFLSWAQIDAMFGTSRNQSLAMYDEAHGKEGAWREKHLVSREGEEGMRPKATPSAKSSDGRAAIDAKPVFGGDENRAEIVSKVEGKNITWNGSGSMEGKSFKAKVVSVTKVGQSKSGRVVQFNDGQKGRTVILTSIVKVGGR